MNYYDVLRINKDASEQEIKDAYKKLIKRYHPDVYPGNKVRAESITRDLNEAYDVLSDSEKKAIYDLSLEPTPINTEPNIPIKSDTSILHEEDFGTSASPTWEQKLKENIHEFVENQSQTMPQNTKTRIVFIIILIAIIIFLLTVKDYLDFQLLLKEKENLQNLEESQTIEIIEE